MASKLSSRLGAAALLSVSCFGAAALAESAKPADKEKLVAAIVKHGCKVTDSNNEAILADAGLDPVVARNVVAALVAEGVAKPEGSDLVLKTEGCN